LHFSNYPTDYIPNIAFLRLRVTGVALRVALLLAFLRVALLLVALLLVALLLAFLLALFLALLRCFLSVLLLLFGPQYSRLFSLFKTFLLVYNKGSIGLLNLRSLFL
jgi:hypothetical protein